MRNEDNVTAHDISRCEQGLWQCAMREIGNAYVRKVKRALPAMFSLLLLTQHLVYTLNTNVNLDIVIVIVNCHDHERSLYSTPQPPVTGNQPC